MRKDGLREKKQNRPIRLFSAVLFCLPMTSTDALGSVLSCPEQGRLAVSGGRLEAQAPLQSLVEEYFDLREMAFSETTVAANAVQGTANCLSDAIQANEQARRPMIASMEARGKLQCHGAESVPLVENAQILGNGDVRLSVYEWIWVDYTMEGFDTIDRMGYGVEHEIIACPAGGSYLIVSDEYDEGTVTGMTTDARLRSERLAKAETSISRESVRLTTEEQSRGIQIMDVSPEGTAAASAGISNYFPARAIEYADRYVTRVIDYGNGTTDYGNYNLTFGYTPGNDCCNYVSQCLYTGGVAMDRSGTPWYCNLNNPPSTNLSCSNSWSSIYYFRKYFRDYRGCEEVNVTNSYNHIYPGNPVYSTGHAGICVGYNSAGVPIVNTHTNDVYHCPYTMAFNSGSTLYTMKITTDNTMEHSPANPVAALTLTDNHMANGSLTFGNGQVDFIKITLNTTATYTMYTLGSWDTKAYLYKNIVYDTTSDQPMYLYELAQDDDSGDGNNFTITYTFSPGTYYLSVRFFSQSTVGGYIVYFVRE